MSPARKRLGLVFGLGVAAATAAWGVSQTDPVGPSLREPEVTLSLERSPRAITLDAFAAASHSISAVVYKFRDRKILDALVAALERGLTVRVLLDGKEATNKRSLARDLVKVGAHVRVWDRARGKLHAKFVVLDARRALLGSYNWTLNGATSNVEMLASFEGPDTVALFATLFETLWRGGHSLEPSRATQKDSCSRVPGLRGAGSEIRDPRKPAPIPAPLPSTPTPPCQASAKRDRPLPTHTVALPSVMSQFNDTLSPHGTAGFSERDDDSTRVNPKLRFCPKTVSVSIY